MNKAKSNALIIGAISITTYIVNYFLRNLLSVLSPQMLETGKFTVAFIATLSSTYMLFYAGGQLINGILGDVFSPKMMVSVGIFSGGVVLVIYPYMPVKVIQVCCFAVLGFALSMVRGPLMKIIAENTLPDYARKICVFFSFASFCGPLIASCIAIVFKWKAAFTFSGVLAVCMAACAFIAFSKMEKAGTIAYKTSKLKGNNGVLAVFRIEKFAFYIIIACLVEIGATSISFWIPTYLTGQLFFGKATANMIYSVISIFRSCMPFLALFIFKKSHENDIAILRISFLTVAVFFAAMMISHNRWFSIVFMVIALMSVSCSSALLWSIYIPGLGKTGKVSSVNGVLDCIGYIAAALANMLFSFVMTQIGWNGIYTLWSLLGVIGVATTFMFRNKKDQTTVKTA